MLGYKMQKLRRFSPFNKECKFVQGFEIQRDKYAAWATNSAFFAPARFFPL